MAFGLLIGLSPCVTPASSGNRDSKEIICPAGRYVVSGGPIVLGPAAPPTTSALMGQRYISIDDACSAKRARKIRTTRKGVTKVRARWRTCDGLEGRVSLRANIARNCTELKGRIRARGSERRFEALLTRAVADLQVGASCDDVLAAFHGRAISEMERRLEVNEETALRWLKRRGRNPDGDYRLPGRRPGS